jgi:predicted HTH domain antitoxin
MKIFSLRSLRSFAAIESDLPDGRLAMYLPAKMTLTIPTERLGIVLDERDAVVDIAIGLYKRQMVSLGRAAEVAGLASVEFLAELGRRRIPINYGVDELHEDLAALQQPA